MQSATARHRSDGYVQAAAIEPAREQICRELHAIVMAAPFGGKATPWLQARAAVLATVERAESCQQLARAMWLVEDLVYDDLLKGTGWGRRRSWFRERLEVAGTLSQVVLPHPC